MKTTLFVFVLFASLFIGSPVQAGVEPSPFKGFIESKINLIVDRIMPLTKDGDPKVLEQATAVVELLKSVNVKHIKRQRVATQSLIIMERISSVLFDPQPEPPGYQLTALNILARLSIVAFDPQPEPPGHTMSFLAVLDRISSVGFDPQPEPPGLGPDKLLATMEVLDGISSIAFDPQPEPPGKTFKIMGVFDAVTSIAFDPQPEPPGQPVKEMFRILNLLGTIAPSMEDVPGTPGF